MRLHGATGLGVGAAVAQIAGHGSSELARRDVTEIATPF